MYVLVFFETSNVLKYIYIYILLYIYIYIYICMYIV
jgi:hypothetical protein